MPRSLSSRGDERVAAILADPQRYFAEATARAQVVAAAEVQVDLAARAHHRHKHGWPRADFAARPGH